MYDALRVDRQHINSGKWDDTLDLQIYSEPWKDSHFCQESYTLRCFWKIHYLLKPFLAKERLFDLVNYRFEFTEKFPVLPSSVKNAHQNERTFFSGRPERT